MIIQIRGTSGSGKSTAMRRVMEGMGLTSWAAMYRAKRRPLFYQRSSCDLYPPTVVLGHYQVACGGCDTVGSAPKVYELATELCPNWVVLCEGLLLSEDVKWTSQMEDCRVVFLTTDIEACISRIKQRRADAGNTKMLSELNTRGRVGVIERARTRLLAAGIECRRSSSDQAPRMILSWLRKYWSSARSC